MSLSKTKAREIAKTISNEDVKMMLEIAKELIPDWTKPSRLLPRFSKGKFWNTFAKSFDPTMFQSEQLKSNLIYEYGQYLPFHIKNVSKTQSQTPKVKTIVHQEPEFE